MSISVNVAGPIHLMEKWAKTGGRKCVCYKGEDVGWEAQVLIDADATAAKSTAGLCVIQRVTIVDEWFSRAGRCGKAEIKAVDVFPMSGATGHFTDAPAHAVPHDPTECKEGCRIEGLAFGELYFARPKFQTDGSSAAPGGKGTVAVTAKKGGRKIGPLQDDPQGNPQTGTPYPTVEQWDATIDENRDDSLGSAGWMISPWVPHCHAQNTIITEQQARDGWVVPATRPSESEDGPAPIAPTAPIKTDNAWVRDGKGGWKLVSHDITPGSDRRLAMVASRSVAEALAALGSSSMSRTRVLARSPITRQWLQSRMIAWGPERRKSSVPPHLVPGLVGRPNDQFLTGSTADIDPSAID